MRSWFYIALCFLFISNSLFAREVTLCISHSAGGIHDMMINCPLGWGNRTEGRNIKIRSSRVVIPIGEDSAFISNAVSQSIKASNESIKNEILKLAETNAKSLIDTNMNSVKAQLSNDLKDIPNKLLAEETITLIKDSVLSELQEENQKLKEEIKLMRAELDAIRQSLN